MKVLTGKVDIHKQKMVKLKNNCGSLKHIWVMMSEYIYSYIM